MISTLAEVFGILLATLFMLGGPLLFLHDRMPVEKITSRRETPQASPRVRFNAVHDLRPTSEDPEGSGVPAPRMPGSPPALDEAHTPRCRAVLGRRSQA